MNYNFVSHSRNFWELNYNFVSQCRKIEKIYKNFALFSPKALWDDLHFCSQCRKLWETIFSQCWKIARCTTCLSHCGERFVAKITVLSRSVEKSCFTVSYHSPEILRVELQFFLAVSKRLWGEEHFCPTVPKSLRRKSQFCLTVSKKVWSDLIFFLTVPKILRSDYNNVEKFVVPRVSPSVRNFLWWKSKLSRSFRKKCSVEKSDLIFFLTVPKILRGDLHFSHNVEKLVRCTTCLSHCGERFVAKITVLSRSVENFESCFTVSYHSPEILRVELQFYLTVSKKLWA